VAYVKRSLDELINRDDPAWPEVGHPPGDRAFSFYPPLSAEGGPIEARHRATVPLAKLFRLHVGAI
jgi:hypothetical protein